MANPIPERSPQIKAEAAAPRMKAAICTAYGSPDVVQIRDVEKPVPKDDEVLIMGSRGFPQSRRLAHQER
jgi:hypothetical protein